MAFFDIFRKEKKSDSENSTLANPLGNDLIANTEFFLAETSPDFAKQAAYVLPLEQLATLGSGISSLLPGFRTVTTTPTLGSEKLYRCILPKPGQLAISKTDNLPIGIIRNKNKIIAQARWEPVDPKSITTKSVVAFNPATLAMAAALATMEKKIEEIVKLEKDILSFLEEDKEAKIEGDLKTLTTMFKELKYNWDNALYVSSHHQLAADIKRSSEQNIIFYQKQLSDILKETPKVFMQRFVNTSETSLQKSFQYYRISLYLYAFASFIEVMLQQNSQEEYIEEVKEAICERTNTYDELFNICRDRLDKLSSGSVEHYILKGLGSAGKAVGSFIGSIPIIKDGQVDEWLEKSGEELKKTGECFGKEVLTLFDSIREPGSRIFITNLDQVNLFFNQTQDICIDKNNIYFFPMKISA